jgi:redox-sensitive bicupin YhaK (pirin superfamily)
MKKIAKVVHATPLNGNDENREIWRVIGTTDIKNQGTAHAIAHIDPIIFLDEAKLHGNVPTAFKKHPHMGLAAISYLIEGEFTAWDNLNGVLPEKTRVGGVYYINSGRGVVHGEASAEENRNAHWFQLWINPGVHKKPLPKASYQLYQPQDIPIYEENKLKVRVVVGSAYGQTSPVKSDISLQYLHIQMDANTKKYFELPDSKWQGFIYIIKGSGAFGEDKTLGEAQHCLILENDLQTEIEIKSDDHLLEFILVSGLPHQRGSYKLLGHGGALVSDTKEDLYAAMKRFSIEGENFGK